MAPWANLNAPFQAKTGALGEVGTVPIKCPMVQ